VTWLGVDMEALSPAPFGVALPPRLGMRAGGFVRYMAALEAFQRLDARAYDLLVTTQPPSFAVEHPRHLSLFSHHQRLYYDLCDVWIAAGYAEEERHRHAAALVRRVDQRHLARVGLFLAASEVVRERLRHFNGLEDNVGVYLAGTGLHETLLASGAAPAVDAAAHVLCVTRQEFTKRAELFVHAMAYLPDVPARLVGSGGRLRFTVDLARRLTTPGTDLDAVDDTELWLNLGVMPNGVAAAAPATGAIRFLGQVDDAELARLYAGAICVVAPAYLEDYGLTVIEAMSAGRPVVVCRDGGGVCLPVVDGVNGFVVEPTGRAIADAVSRLREDPALARTMGENARASAAEYTWERAMRQIMDGVERLCG
ncbi:MAG TPA: glycosyltransferase family 4 protein, partial [Candidatus Dormibacteraeota bacterium]